MIQQVNLYQPIFRKQPKVFSAKAMLQTCLAVAVGLLLIYGYGWWQMERLQRERARLEAQESERVARLEALVKRYPPPKKDAALAAEVQRLSAELDAKRRAKAALSGGGLGNTDGFSHYLEGLARRRVPSLWLTGVQIHKGGEQFTLSGSTLRPEQVARFLKSLSREKSFTGKTFHRLLMTRPKEDPARVDFVLRTAVDKGGQQ